MDGEIGNQKHLYQVNVVLWEGRHLALKNANSKVVISIDKVKKTILSKNNKTDCPYYNDFCVFPFRLPLNVLLDKILIIKVYQKSITLKLIGSFSVELATVWSQPNHQFYRKWAVLMDPKNPASGMKGFLKCDIAVLTEGTVAKPPNEEQNRFEESLLVPYGGTQDRRKIRIVLSLFRADCFSPSFEKFKISKPYVKVTFGERVRKTSVAKNRENPVWNEEVAFVDMFPPLIQNLHIEIRGVKSSKKSIGNTTIDIRSLYEDGQNGFLPTFGPNFLYLYRPLKNFHRHKNCCTTENSFTYAGRLLLALRTEVIDKLDKDSLLKRKPKITPKSIPPLIEKVYFEYSKFILFAAIFDALLFDAKYPERNIKIRITMGPKKNLEISQYKKRKKEKKAKIVKEKKTKVSLKKEKKMQVVTTREKKLRAPPKKEKTGQEFTKKAKKTALGNYSMKHLSVITDCNSTPKLSCSQKGDYNYITFTGNFPCVNVFGEWPNSLQRIYCSNVIKQTIEHCSNEVNRIKYDLQFQSEKRSEFSKKLKTTLADLSKTCEIILRLTKPIKLNETNLCRQRKKFYHREIEDIARKTKIASKQKALKAEDELTKISYYLARLTKYAQNPENCFPDTEIWLLRDNRTLSQCRIRIEDVAFSENSHYRGVMSGKTQTILFRGKKGKIKAKLEILVWFGLADKFNECLKTLPGGLNINNPICDLAPDVRIPSRLICEEKYNFQCKVHIFQGKIFFGFDNTGLSDAFVRVIIQGQNKQTKVRKCTLSPIWDETLTFPFVTVFGSPKYIKENPPCITVEVFDQDKHSKSELIGRCFLKPLIKFSRDKYKPPLFPPKLEWMYINSDLKEVGQILIASELLEHFDKSKNIKIDKTTKSETVPENIRPHNVKYRLEILFWGVRPIRKKRCIKNKVFVILECGDYVIKSPLLKNIRHKLNFSGPIRNVELDLPEELDYAPPFSFKLFHVGSITRRVTYVATCLVPTIKYLLLSQLTFEEKEHEKAFHFLMTSKGRKEKQKKETRKRRKILLKSAVNTVGENINSGLYRFYIFCKCKIFRSCRGAAYEGKPDEEDETLSWWVKYNSSDEDNSKPTKSSSVPLLKVYKEELEAQPEFKGFQDFLQSYDLVTGHEKKFKKGNLVAKVKAVLKLHRQTQENSKRNAEKGLLITAFSNETLKFLARVYIVCGKNLAARDIYGKSDPYLFLQLGKHSISDRQHYASKQLNPTFGKCFEFHGTFPRDYLLQIKVLDYDKSSKDDLIGQTTIDLENRFYSKFHATCGIASRYETTGFNFWRDIYHPSEILALLCKQLNLSSPIYKGNRVVIEGYPFITPVPNRLEHKKEIQSLMVLRNWHEMPIYGFHLVPEHVETRSLYHPSLPGIEQGKLVLWVDIFPADFSFMPPKVDITPQTPVAMELRAIIWNVVDVVLDDKSILFNGRLSDIYLKGWILSLEEEMQKTDVHYRSLNGEGNFNWRFIFHFNYIPIERKMTVTKKINAFDLHPEERKVHCKLEIQVWDNDAFGDDFLGTLILELCSMPRGAKLPSRCTLKMLAPSAGKINLFKIKRTRGWWPFRRLKMKEAVDNEFELTGKVDLELEILTQAEALHFPVGKGRDEPNALPPPDRPDISSNRILNPIKTFHYVIFNRAKKIIFVVVLLLLVVFFFAVALYSFPNYLVKKLLRA